MLGLEGYSVISEVCWFGSKNRSNSEPMSYFVLIWQASAKKEKKSVKKIIHTNSNTSAMSKTDLAALMKARLKRELRMIVNGATLFLFFSKQLMQHDLDAWCPEGSGQVKGERRAEPKRWWTLNWWREIKRLWSGLASSSSSSSSSSCAKLCTCTPNYTSHSLMSKLITARHHLQYTSHKGARKSTLLVGSSHHFIS